MAARDLLGERSALALTSGSALNRAHAWCFGISCLDGTGEARLIRDAVGKGGGDRLHRLVDAAAGAFFSGRATATIAPRIGLFPPSQMLSIAPVPRMSVPWW